MGQKHVHILTAVYKQQNIYLTITVKQLYKLVTKSGRPGFESYNILNLFIV